MAVDDIYKSKARYERYMATFQKLAVKPSDAVRKLGQRKYYCRNPANVKWFFELVKKFESRDTSYIRRCKLLDTLLLACYVTKKELSDCDRDDTDAIVRFMHTVYKTPKTKGDFVRDIRFIWKLLLPEKDEKGRIDDSVCPYPIRHLSAKMDKSREKRRKDKLSFEETEKLIQYFSLDPCIQAFVALSIDSLGRPQEICYTKVSDLEIYENYAKVWISEHGKEGTGFLQCIDSFPYMLRWYNQHPLRDNPESFLFLGKSKKQLTPLAVNKRLARACSLLGIDKPITCYSLKRNGVTLKRHLGYSDLEIQHAARWTSTKQLQIYDLSDQDDAFKIQLAKRGLISDEKYKQLTPHTRKCAYCKTMNGFTERICSNCQRPLNGEEIRKEISFSDDGKNLKLIQLFKELLDENPNLVEGMAKKVGLLD